VQGQKSWGKVISPINASLTSWNPVMVTVWHKANTKYENENLVSTVKHGGGVMVWRICFY
jgi:hypothetical protein